MVRFKDKKGSRITNDFQKKKKKKKREKKKTKKKKKKKIDESNCKPNKAWIKTWVDEGSQFYNRSIKPC